MSNKTVQEIRAKESSDSLENTIEVVKSLGEDNPATVDTIKQLEFRYQDALEKEKNIANLHKHYQELWDELSGYVIDNHRLVAHAGSKTPRGKEIVEILVEKLGWNPPEDLHALEVTDSTDVSDTMHYDTFDRPDTEEGYYLESGNSTDTGSVEFNEVSPTDN